MLKNHLKIAWRNLRKNKGYALINIGGLALGFAITLLIGLWIYDELSFNKEHPQYEQIAQVLQNTNFEGTVETWESQNFPLGDVLRDEYGEYFDKVVMSTYPRTSILKHGENIIGEYGSFMQKGAPEILNLNMIHGSADTFGDPNSIFLSATLANTLFGEQNPMGNSIKLNNNYVLKVSGVYEDLPRNSSFSDALGYLASLNLLTDGAGPNMRGWRNNWLVAYVKVAKNVTMEQASALIKDVKLDRAGEQEAQSNPQLFLHPLAKWRLYSHFENGVSIGGQITYVWLFGFIGAFVLLLASINFINLSTARSQKRAEEVGIRKVIGSSKLQLIRQFFMESLMVVLLSFFLALLLAQLALPLFNEITQKDVGILWGHPMLWVMFFVSVGLVGVLSGLYPAFYLSSFIPIKVLKGLPKSAAGGNVRFRQALVILQFVVSVTLVIGTLVIYQQIQHVKNRSLGYEVQGLVTVPLSTGEVRKNYTALRNTLLESNAFMEIARSEAPITNTWYSDFDYKWKGKDPGFRDNIFRGLVDYDFGETVGWNILKGRDFSRAFPTDSTAVILNEAAVKYMGFEDPIGEIIEAPWGENFTVIGVVEDMVTQSLYESNKQTMFRFDNYGGANLMNIKLNPDVGSVQAIQELDAAFKQFNPNTPLEYSFAEDEYAEKFAFEARVGKLSGIFAGLAIFISCLGLLGLASFVAERRTKEIGIRKVLGASVSMLWQMLSKEFVGLVLFGSALAIPLASYMMQQWLKDYDYRTEISWSLYGYAALGAVLVTLLTVSFQTLRAAQNNPIKSLRTE
ncbi:MAG: ABC transporter permease [Bacteroidota bacterium]